MPAFSDRGTVHSLPLSRFFLGRRCHNPPCHYRNSCPHFGRCETEPELKVWREYTQCLNMINDDLRNEAFNHTIWRPPRTPHAWLHSISYSILTITMTRFDRSMYSGYLVTYVRQLISHIILIVFAIKPIYPLYSLRKCYPVCLE